MHGNDTSPQNFTSWGFVLIGGAIAAFVCRDMASYLAPNGSNVTRLIVWGILLLASLRFIRLLVQRRTTRVDASPSHNESLWQRTNALAAAASGALWWMSLEWLSKPGKKTSEVWSSWAVFLFACLSLVRLHLNELRD